jgi:hypothetical protein
MSADGPGAEASKISKRDNQGKQQGPPATTNTSKMRQLINEAFSAYEVRKKLFSQLSAYEVAKLSWSFGIGLDERERRKYLNIARDIFQDTGPIDRLIAQGVAITLMGSNLHILTRRLRDPNWYESMRADRLYSLRKKRNDPSQELAKHRIWIAVLAPLSPARIEGDINSSGSMQAFFDDIEIPGEWRDSLEDGNLPGGPFYFFRAPPTDKWTMANPVDVTFRVDRLVRHSGNKICLYGTEEHTFTKVPTLPVDGLVIEYIRLHRNPFVVRKQRSIGDGTLQLGLNRHKLMLALIPSFVRTCQIFPIPMFDCCDRPSCFQDQDDQDKELIDCCSCNGGCEAVQQYPLPVIRHEARIPIGLIQAIRAASDAIPPGNRFVFESIFFSRDPRNLTSAS